MVARALWQGSETDFRSPNSYSWSTKQSCACKSHLKLSIHCCGGSKGQDSVFLWHWVPSTPIDFCRSSIPYLRWDPDARQNPPCIVNLDTYSKWEPWCSLKKCWHGCPEELGCRAWHKADQKVNVAAASVTAMLRLCYVDNQLKNQEHISFLHNPFNGLFAVVFFSLLYLLFSGIHYCFLLPLFPWHSTFYPFWFLPFIFSIFSFCLLCFPVVSQLFFLLPLLTFLPDSWGLSQSLLKSIHYLQRV